MTIAVHAFVGRHDRSCEECGAADHAPIHRTTEEPQKGSSEARLSAGGTPDGVATGNGTQSVKSWLPAGAFMTDDHRYYFNGHGPVPGVTSVLEVMDKPALSVWKAQQAVRAVLRRAEAISAGEISTEQILTEFGSEDAIVKWALAEVRKSRDTSANVGSDVHRLADMVSRGSESDSKTWEVSESTQPYLDAYRAFTDRYSASSFVSSEKMVWSLNGYGGTYDLLMMIDHELWLIDIKTGKSLYPEFRLQLAAYRWADSIILPGNPLSYVMPNVERTGILHLRPDQYPTDGYRLYEVPTSYTEDYLPFLGLLEVHKWKQRKVQPIKQ